MVILYACISASLFPSSVSISSGVVEEVWLSVKVPGGKLTKVGHGYSPAPLLPLETPRICTLTGNPTGLCSFLYLCFILFYLCRFLFLSLSVPCFYCGLSLLLCAASLVSSSALVCGDIFLLDTNSDFFSLSASCHRNFTYVHCCYFSSIVWVHIFNTHLNNTPKAAVTPFLILTPSTFLSFVPFLVSGLTQCLMTPPNHQATHALCASQTHTHALMPSRCHTGMCSSTLETSPSWACPLRSRSSTTG